jgi:hypothetical protein
MYFNAFYIQEDGLVWPLHEPSNLYNRSGMLQLSDDLSTHIHVSNACYAHTERPAFMRSGVPTGGAALTLLAILLQKRYTGGTSLAVSVFRA